MTNEFSTILPNTEEALSNSSSYESNCEASDHLGVAPIRVRDLVVCGMTDFRLPEMALYQSEKLNRLSFYFSDRLHHARLIPLMYRAPTSRIRGYFPIKHLYEGCARYINSGLCWNSEKESSLKSLFLVYHNFYRMIQTQNSASTPKENTQKITTKKEYEVNERGSHNIAMGMPNPHPIPEFNTKEEERDWAKQHVAAAFRVFARKGYTGGVAGHISLRDPVNPNTFWINPLGKHFGLIKASDLVHTDEEGNILPDGPQSAINSAGFAIHLAVHKARPDVNASCHTHSTYGKAFSALGRELDIISQDVCTFYKSHSVYKGFGGVAIDLKEGVEIAKALGNSKGVILQNHGLLTVGKTVDEAAYLYTLMENSCKCQLLADAALRPGEKLKICDEEAAVFSEQVQSDPETLFSEFQPEFEMELFYNADFME